MQNVAAVCGMLEVAGNQRMCNNCRERVSAVSPTESKTDHMDPIIMHHNKFVFGDGPWPMTPFTNGMS